MFDITRLLTKPIMTALLIGLALASATSVGLFGYSYYVNYKNDKLQQQLTLTSATLANLNAKVVEERRLHMSTLTALEAREKQREAHTLEATQLRNRLAEIIRNEEDECLNTALPPSVVNLLQSISDGS